MTLTLPRVTILGLAVAGAAVALAGCYAIPSDPFEQDSGTGIQGSQSGDAATADSPTPPSTVDAGSLDAASYPTDSWTGIYLSYFAGNTTLGHCAASGCHSAASESANVNCDTASDCYKALQGRGYISGTSSSIADPNQSLLTWVSQYGDMPKDGTIGDAGAAAAAALTQWVQAGALNN